MTTEKVKKPRNKKEISIETKQLDNILTLSVIDDMYSKYDEQKEIEFQGYIVKLDKKFKITKVDKFIKEYRKHIKEQADGGVELTTDENAEFLRSLSLILITKTFTNLPISDTWDHKQLLFYLDKLINIGLFEIVWNSFDKDQVDWLNEKLVLAARVMKDARDNFETEIDKMEKLLADVGDGVIA